MFLFFLHFGILWTFVCSLLSLSDCTVRTIIEFNYECSCILISLYFPDITMSLGTLKGAFLNKMYYYYKTPFIKFIANMHLYSVMKY